MLAVSQDASTSDHPERSRVRVVIHGAVQGVGFRPFVFRLALELGLNGWVNNSAAGVVIEAEGRTSAVREFLLRLESNRPAIAVVQSLEATFLDPLGIVGFEIRESTGGEKRTLVMPDLATCPACLADVFDPRNRRFRYPFTNCTNCGPQAWQALGWAWKRRSAGSSYSRWHAGHIVKPPMVVAARS